MVPPKKTVASALTVFLILSLTSASSFASSKVAAGKSCKTSKQKVTFEGKTFTCVKSGKKLIWNKGVVLRKPANQPLVIPTPSASPAQAEAPSTTQVPVALWQETQFKILQEFKSLKPSAIQELDFVLSPNADKGTARKLQESYQEPITYLSNLYVNPRKVTFLVMNENDKDWWLAQFKELSPNAKPDWWGGSHCDVIPKAHCGYGSSPNPDGTFHFGQLLGSESVWQDRDYTIAYHEAIHVYQLGLMGNRMDKLPNWFAEGQANYLGFTFSHKFIDSRLQRNIQTWRVKDFAGVEKFSDQQWFEWLQKIDSDNEYTFTLQLGYSVGLLIVEALYNQYDTRKIHDWMVAIKNGNDYKSAFKSVFGQDYDSWMREVAAPYLNSQI